MNDELEKLAKDVANVPIEDIGIPMVRVGGITRKSRIANSWNSWGCRVFDRKKESERIFNHG